jgi:ribonuclease PH
VGGGNGLTTAPGEAAEHAATYKSILLDVLHSSVCLAAYPRCTLVVACRVLHDDGSCLAALVNAAAAALMDAGVDMVCVPVGATFAWRSRTIEPPSHGLPPQPQLVVDPDAAEEAALATVTVVCCTAPALNHQLLAVHAVGCLDDAALPACVEAAQQVAQTMAQISRRKNDAR